MVVVSYLFQLKEEINMEQKAKTCYNSPLNEMKEAMKTQPKAMTCYNSPLNEMKAMQQQKNK